MNGPPVKCPRVSVVVAAYEASGFVGAAVASALGQTLEDIEVIVVDDASRDDTLAAARAAAAGDPRLVTIRLERNGGPSAARNAALRAARGDWVAVLDADDAMEPERLEALLAFVEAERADIVADWLLVIEEGRAPEVLKPNGMPSPLTLAAYARDNSLGGTGCSGYLKPMFRRAFLVEHALAYDESLRVAEDWTLIADALALGARYAILDRPLYRYAVHAGSISHRLSVGKLEAMAASADAFDARHAARLDADTKAALGQRRGSVLDWLAFQTFVDELKARRPAPALAALARRPSAWPLLSGPILARLGGRRGGRKLV